MAATDTSMTGLRKAAVLLVGMGKEASARVISVMNDREIELIAAEVMRVHPNFTIEHWRKVPPLRHPEDLELYIHGLRKAGLS